MDADPVLGLTTMLVLLALWGYFQWLGTRLMGDDAHRSSLLAASLGTLLATAFVVTAGNEAVVFAAAVVPWVMVALFAYRESAFMAVGAGLGAWAVWWVILAFAAWLLGIRASVAA